MRAANRVGRGSSPLAWIGGIALLYLAVYVVVAAPVLLAQGLLAEGQRELLTFFSVDGSFAPAALTGQLLRGAVLAAVLYPFRETLARHPRRRWVLIGVFWGLAVVGSVEPLPGSIEGWIYTVTGPSAHLLVLAATGVHALALAWSVPWAVGWTRHGADAAARGVSPAGRSPGRAGTVVRFVALHVVTYLAVGVTFFVVQDYAAAFETQAQFQHYRPLDDVRVGLAVPLQVPRGLVLALCMAPFVRAATPWRGGWLALFGLLFGATALANVVQGMLAGPIGLSLSSLAVGLPELVIQMLLFAWLLVAWERRTGRRERDRPAVPRAQGRGARRGRPPA